MREIKFLIIFSLIFLLNDAFAAVTTVKPTTKAPATTTKKSVVTTKTATKKPTITTKSSVTTKPTMVPLANFYSTSVKDPLARAIVGYSTIQIITTTTKKPATTTKTLPLLGTARGISVSVPFMSSFSRMLPIVEPSGSGTGGSGTGESATSGFGSGGSGTGGSGTGASGTGASGTGVSGPSRRYPGSSGYYPSGTGVSGPSKRYPSGTGNSGPDNTAFGTGEESWNAKPNVSNGKGSTGHSKDEDKHIKETMAPPKKNDNNKNNNDNNNDYNDNNDKNDRNQNKRKNSNENKIGLGGKGFSGKMGKIKDILSTVTDGFRKIVQNKGNKGMQDNSDENEGDAHSGKRG